MLKRHPATILFCDRLVAFDAPSSRSIPDTGTLLSFMFRNGAMYFVAIMTTDLANTLTFLVGLRVSF
uniref:Uncharacterized protein n=1 Tax=Moniliophthora roreri TaxID=221103 RepID=A0A0W0FSN2_MONRR